MSGSASAYTAIVGLVCFMIQQQEVGSKKTYHCNHTDALCDSETRRGKLHREKQLEDLTKIPPQVEVRTCVRQGMCMCACVFRAWACVHVQDSVMLACGWGVTCASIPCIGTR